MVWISSVPELSWAGDASSDEEDDSLTTVILWHIAIVHRVYITPVIVPFDKVILLDKMCPGMDLESSSGSELFDDMLEHHSEVMETDKSLRKCDPTKSEVSQDAGDLRSLVDKPSDSKPRSFKALIKWHGFCLTMLLYPLITTTTIILSRIHIAIFLFQCGCSPSALAMPSLHSAEVHRDTMMIETREATAAAMWTFPLVGWPNTGYCAKMKFGINHQQQFCLIVDSGSANTAIAAVYDRSLSSKEFYDMDSTGEDFRNTSRSVSVSYSSGMWAGFLVSDKVGFGGFSMNESLFALITSSSEFFIEGSDWVGILGLAYSSLAKPDSGIGTLWDSLRDANGLQDVFSIQLCPPRESTLFPGTYIRQGGFMTMGGINGSLHSPDKKIHYTSIVQERFFNVLLTDISVGDKKINMSCKEFNSDKTIVDSGTTDIFFPDKVFESIIESFIEYFEDGVPVSVPNDFWSGENKLLWRAAHVDEIYDHFPTIHLSMAYHLNSSQEFSLAVVPQMYLRQIDVQAGDENSTICPPTSPCDAFTFGIKHRPRGTIIGANVMLGYYTIFDRENKRVGFIESSCDYRNSRTAPYISGPHLREPRDCEMPQTGRHWTRITYYCGAITMALAVTMTIIVVTVQTHRCFKSSSRPSAIKRRIAKRVKFDRRSTVKPLRICCGKTEATDEGYHSECGSPQYDTSNYSTPQYETSSHSPTIEHQGSFTRGSNIENQENSDDYSTLEPNYPSMTTDTSPSTTQDSEHGVLVLPLPCPQSTVATNGVELVTVKDSSTKGRSASAARNRSKRRKKSKFRRRKQPVMESESGEQYSGILCLPESVSHPRQTTERSVANTTHLRSLDRTTLQFIPALCDSHSDSSHTNVIIPAHSNLCTVELECHV